MVEGKIVKKRFHSSEEASTSRDPHEQDSGGDISDGDDRDSESTRTSDGEGSAPTRTGEEEQGSAAAAPDARCASPPRPRLYASPAPRPISNVEHHRQLAGHLYEMEMDDVLNRRRETLSPLAAKYYTHLLESASSPVSVALPASSSVTSSVDYIFDKPPGFVLYYTRNNVLLPPSRK